MSRSDDFATYVSNLKGLPPAPTIQDMTPIPLTTTDATPGIMTSTATGPWLRNPGKSGAVHAEISDTTTPTATLVVEYSNTKTAKGPVVEDTLTFTAAGQGKGSICYNGYAWVRVRCTAISGTNASVTAVIGFGG